MHGDTRTLTVQIGTSRDLRATNARRDPLWRKVHWRGVLRSLRARLTSGWALSTVITAALWVGFAIAIGVMRWTQ